MMRAEGGCRCRQGTGRVEPSSPSSLAAGGRPFIISRTVLLYDQTRTRLRRISRVAFLPISKPGLRSGSSPLSKRRIASQNSSISQGRQGWELRRQMSPRASRLSRTRGRYQQGTSPAAPDGSEYSPGVTRRIEERKLSSPFQVPVTYNVGSIDLVSS